MQVVCEQMLNNVFFKVKCLFCHRLSGALMLGQYLMYTFLLTMFVNLSSHNFMISMCGRIRKWNQLNLTATHWFNASTFFRQSFCNLLVSCSEKTVVRTLSLTFKKGLRYRHFACKGDYGLLQNQSWRVFTLNANLFHNTYDNLTIHILSEKCVNLTFYIIHQGQ